MSYAVKTMNGLTTADAGVIVTAEHEDGEPLLTFHVPGKWREALTAACRRIDALGEGWYVRTISSPRTIYRDLQGPREAGHGRSHKRTSRRDSFSEDPRPEIESLAAVGRLDLLRPMRRSFGITRPR